MTKKPRPSQLSGQTVEVETPCGCIYITINQREGQPFEVFSRLGKSGGCTSAVVNAVTSSLSVGLRSGAAVEDLARALTGISCHRPPALDPDFGKITSCVDAIGKVLQGREE